MAFAWPALSVTALRGGPALRTDTWHQSFLNLSTDRRKPAALSLNSFGGFVPATPARWYGVGSTLSLRPAALVNGSLRLDYWRSRDPTQWVSRREAAGSSECRIGRGRLPTPTRLREGRLAGRTSAASDPVHESPRHPIL